MSVSWIARPGLQAASVVQQEVIVLSLDLNGGGVQSSGYAGYIESIHDCRSRVISSRPYKNPGRPTHRRDALSGAYHGEPAPIPYSLYPSVPERRYRDPLRDAQGIPGSEISFESHADDRSCAGSVAPHRFYLNVAMRP